MAVRKLVVYLARMLALGVCGVLTLFAFAPIVIFSIKGHSFPVEAGALPMPSAAGMPQAEPAIRDP